MKNYFVLMLLILSVSFSCFGESAADLNKEYSKIITNTLKGECVKDNLDIELAETYYLPAMNNKTNIVFGIKLKAINKESKISEKMDVVVSFFKKDEPGKAVNLKSDFLYNSSVNDVFYFEIQSDPGECVLALLVSDQKLVNKYSLKKELEVKNMFPMRLDFSSVILYKKIERMKEMAKGFEVYKNSFAMGQFKVYPQYSAIDTAADQPSVLFFINGASKNSMSKKYRVKIDYILKKEGKKIQKYKGGILPSNIVSQPVPLKLKKGNLSGEYEFIINAVDMEKRSSADSAVKLNYK